MASGFALRESSAHRDRIRRSRCARERCRAAQRWRHDDPTVTPLGKILVAKSYNTRGNIEKTTKTDTVKHIPVHPVLVAMLAQWRLAIVESLGRGDWAGIVSSGLALVRAGWKVVAQHS